MRMHTALRVFFVPESALWDKITSADYSWEIFAVIASDMRNIRYAEGR